MQLAGPANPAKPQSALIRTLVSSPPTCYISDINHNCKHRCSAAAAWKECRQKVILRSPSITISALFIIGDAASILDVHDPFTASHSWSCLTTSHVTSDRALNVHHFPLPPDTDRMT